MRRRRALAAFTLAETMVAAAVGSVVMAGLAVGSIGLQRGFAAAEYQVACQEDQLRVFDFIARDLRRAATATISDQNRKLTLTLPGYKALPGSTGPAAPTIVGATVKYAEAPLTVSYYISGTDFIRREGTVDTVLSTRLEHFFAYDTNRPQIELRLNFMPRGATTASVSGKAVTQVSTIVCLRNPEGMLQ
jgi:hypothetical protein